jgi:hypothetical protein
MLSPIYFNYQLVFQADKIEDVITKWMLTAKLKLPAYKAGASGKVLSLYIVPLHPAYAAGLRDTLRSNRKSDDLAEDATKPARRRTCCYVTSVEVCLNVLSCLSGRSQSTPSPPPHPPLEGEGILS